MPQLDPVNTPVVEAPEGVAQPQAEGAAPAVAQPPAGSEDRDAKFEARLQEMQTKNEANVSALQSTYQKQINAIQEKADERAKQAQNMALETLTEEDKAKYQARLREQEHIDLVAEVASLKNQAGDSTVKAEWVSYFDTLYGIKVDSTKYANADDLMQFGFAEVAKKMQELQKAPTSQAPAVPAADPQAPGVVTAPAVLTPGTVGNVTRPTYAQVELAWKDKGGLEGFFEAVEAQEIDPSQVPL